MAVANTIAKGVSKSGVPKCKIVTVVMGDLEACTNDIILVRFVALSIIFSLLKITYLLSSSLDHHSLTL